jgi:hypothetical protein
MISVKHHASWLFQARQRVIPSGYLKQVQRNKFSPWHHLASFFVDIK